MKISREIGSTCKEFTGLGTTETIMTSTEHTLTSGDFQMDLGKQCARTKKQHESLIENIGSSEEIYEVDREVLHKKDSDTKKINETRITFLRIVAILLRL